MIKKMLIAVMLIGAATGANMSVSTMANAGEGHWSIGKGVQCKVVNGKVVCSKSRP